MDFSAPPSVYKGLPHLDKEVKEILPRMTLQHRSFFFASSPVFVEGPFDAMVIAAIQRSLGMSVEAAGSSLVPCLGKEEAGRYLILCNSLNKQAVFLFDLDALFDRRLRIGAGQRSDLTERIASAGHGRYDELVGKLQSALSKAVKLVEAAFTDVVPEGLKALGQRLKQVTESAEDKEIEDKKRFAILISLADSLDDLKILLGETASEVHGFLNAVLEHLASVQIHVLPGGALENYLPSYSGNRFKVPDDVKRQTAIDEQQWLAGGHSKTEILERYRELHSVILKLPARPSVDVLPVVRRELASFLHYLILEMRAGGVKGIEGALGHEWERIDCFAKVDNLSIRSKADFSGAIRVLDRFGIGEYNCFFDQNTQTNNPESLRLDKVETKAES